MDRRTAVITDPWVRDLMSEYVEVIRPRATVQEAAVRMRAFDLGLLPVCESGDLMGVITDRDIALRVTAAGRSPGGTVVEDVMTREVVFCWEDQKVGEAARIMQMHQLRRLIVVDGAGRLKGILSVADLAKSGQEPLAVRVLAAVLAPLAQAAGVES
jgi:CBS domain-containing protein